MFSNGFAKTVAFKLAARYETDRPLNPLFYPERICYRFWAGQDQPPGEKN